MTYYTHVSKDIDVDVEIEDNDILDYIYEDAKRREWFMNKLQEEQLIPYPRDIADMSTIERDQFMKELREQFTLLKLDWPQ
jgi:hypothetical protein